MKDATVGELGFVMIGKNPGLFPLVLLLRTRNQQGVIQIPNPQEFLILAQSPTMEAPEMLMLSETLVGLLLEEMIRTRKQAL